MIAMQDIEDLFFQLFKAMTLKSCVADGKGSFSHKTETPKPSAYFLSADKRSLIKR